MPNIYKIHGFYINELSKPEDVFKQSSERVKSGFQRTGEWNRGKE